MRHPIHHKPPDRKLSHEGIRRDVIVAESDGKSYKAELVKGTMEKPEAVCYEKPVNKPETPVLNDNSDKPDRFTVNTSIEVLKLLRAQSDTLNKILAKLTAIEGRMG